MTIHYTLDNITAAAGSVLTAFPERKVYALHGGMGSGKTTLVSEICRALGIGGAVSSPTFPIINQYALPNGEPVYHIDLYRLSGADEAVAAGVEDALYSGHYCFVEWPELAPEILPDGVVNLFIEVISQTERKITIDGPDSSGD